MGRTYQRGNIWWIQYYGQGQLFRESTRSLLKSAATSLLRLREGEIGQGRLPALKAERTTFEELAELFLQDYQIIGRKTFQRAQELTATLRKTLARFELVESLLNTFSTILLAGSRRAWPMARSIGNSRLSRNVSAGRSTNPSVSDHHATYSPSPRKQCSSRILYRGRI